MRVVKANDSFIRRHRKANVFSGNDFGEGLCVNENEIETVGGTSLLFFMPPMWTFG